jgi:hypothetical protein
MRASCIGGGDLWPYGSLPASDGYRVMSDRDAPKVLVRP